MLGELQFLYPLDSSKCEGTMTVEQSKVLSVMKEWERHCAVTEWRVVLQLVRLWKPFVLASICWMESVCRLLEQSQENHRKEVYVPHLVAEGHETVHRSTMLGVPSWRSYFSRKACQRLPYLRPCRCPSPSIAKLCIGKPKVSTVT